MMGYQRLRVAMLPLLGLLLSVGCTSISATSQEQRWEPVARPCVLIQLGLPPNLSAEQLQLAAQSPFQGPSLQIRAGVLGVCDSKTGAEQLSQLLQQGMLLKLTEVLSPSPSPEPSASPPTAP